MNNIEPLRFEADRKEPVAERSVDSMAESATNFLRELRNSVRGLVRNLLLATLAFAACGVSDHELLTHSEQLTDREHDKIQTVIEQIRLSTKVFSYIAPALDPLFDQHGEALDDDDANQSVIVAMEAAADNLQIFLDEERILKISVEKVEVTFENSHSKGIALGLETPDHDDDYISVVTRPTSGVGIMGLDDAEAKLMHASAHYPFGVHSEKLIETAIEMYVSGERNEEKWIAQVMEDRDFPFLMNFIMESGIGTVLEVPVPFQQQINTGLSYGYELEGTVNAVYVSLLDRAKPFDKRIRDFISYYIDRPPERYLLPMARLTPQEARDALENVRPEYEAQADLARKELLALEDKYGKKYNYRVRPETPKTDNMFDRLDRLDLKIPKIDSTDNGGGFPH